MSAQGCSTGTHTDEAPKAPPPKAAPQVDLKMTSSAAGAETYTSRGSASGTSTPSRAAPEAAPAPKFVEEEDDPSVAPAAGTSCRHNGCSVAFVSDALHRAEGGEEAECTYHPKPVSTTPLCATVPAPNTRTAHFP